MEIKITKGLITEMFWEVLALFGVLGLAAALAVGVRLTTGKW